MVILSIGTGVWLSKVVSSDYQIVWVERLVRSNHSYFVELSIVSVIEFEDYSRVSGLQVI